jgi:hypothetical protein
VKKSKLELQTTPMPSHYKIQSIRDSASNPWLGGLAETFLWLVFTHTNQWIAPEFLIHSHVFCSESIILLPNFQGDKCCWLHNLITYKHCIFGNC